jgi:hypothetical protein
VDTLIKDVRYALRKLMRSPGFAVVAPVTSGQPSWWRVYPVYPTRRPNDRAEEEIETR